MRRTHAADEAAYDFSELYSSINAFFSVAIAAHNVWSVATPVITKLEFPIIDLLLDVADMPPRADEPCDRRQNAEPLPAVQAPLAALPVVHGVINSFAGAARAD